MAYQPRQYGTVPIPMPGPVNPLGGLQDLVSLAGMARSMKKTREADDSEAAIKAALTGANGDFGKASEALGKEGRWIEATKLREEHTKQRTARFEEIEKRLGDHHTIYGQSAQMMREVETNPDLYPQLRPKLVEMASLIDPRLATEIPEQYEPQRVRGMLQFAEGAAVQADAYKRSIALLKASEAAVDDKIKREKLHREALGNVLSVASTEEDWTAAITNAKSAGIMDSVISEFGDWDAEAPTRAVRMLMTPEQRANADKAPTSIVQAILTARAKGDVKEVNALLGLQERMSAAQRQGESPISADIVTAVRNNPSIWNDINPELRGNLIGPLAQAGFDFGAAAKSMTDAQKAVIERWRADAISDLNKRQADGQTEMPEARYRAEVNRIEQSYRVQMGTPASTPAVGTGKASESRDAVLPPDRRSAAAPQGGRTEIVVKGVTVRVGEPVTHNGKKHKVLAITADGQLELDPTPIE